MWNLTRRRKALCVLRAIFDAGVIPSLGQGGSGRSNGLPSPEVAWAHKGGWLWD